MSRRALLGTALGAGLVVSSGSARGLSGEQLASVAARAERVRIPRRRRPGWKVSSIGETSRGTPIERWDSKPETARRHVTVICGTHGDERAMADLADGFGRVDLPADLHLTVVPLLNPDGWAAGTRHNADGVDLNRNFPWQWRRSGVGGREPGSEPESRAAMWMLGTERPDLVIWVHQPLGYIAPLDGCPPHYAQIWSDVADVPVRFDLRQTGGGETWTAIDLGLRSMLLEVGGTRDAAIGVDRHIEALQELMFAVEPV